MERGSDELCQSWDPCEDRLMGNLELKWNLCLSCALAFVAWISCLPTICPLGLWGLTVRGSRLSFLYFQCKAWISKVSKIHLDTCALPDRHGHHPGQPLPSLLWMAMSNSMTNDHFSTPAFYDMFFAGKPEWTSLFGQFNLCITYFVSCMFLPLCFSSHLEYLPLTFLFFKPPCRSFCHFCSFY